MGCDFDTYGLHAAELLDMFKGRRRHWTMAGVDANVRLVTSEPGICGRALQRSDGHVGNADERKAAEFIIAEAAGCDMKVANTFEEVWLPNKMDAPLPTSRSTWSRPIYGTVTQRSIDHLLVDSCTSSRLTRSACRRMSYVSYHMALMNAFDFSEHLPEDHHTRPQGPAKRFGWWRCNTDTYDGALASQLAHRGAIGLTALSDLLVHTAQSIPCLPAKRRAAPGTSATEAALRIELPAPPAARWSAAPR